MLQGSAVNKMLWMYFSKNFIRYKDLQKFPDVKIELKLYFISIYVNGCSMNFKQIGWDDT